MRILSGQTLFLGALAAAGGLVAAGLVLLDHGASAGHPPEVPIFMKDIPFNGTEAYQYMKALCAIGPRPSASDGMHKQQRMIADHFKKLGGQVSFQEFRVRSPLDGSPVPMANLIVQWHPDRPERILLCAHYDTRPFPDRDKHNPKGTFVGANDGASGVAVLMELARFMPNFKSRFGVDFVLFDGEEYVFRDADPNYAGDPYFLGSEWFARVYAGSEPPPAGTPINPAEPPRTFHYKWGVLLDMVGSKDLKIHEESNSWAWEDTRPLVQEIWGVAGKLRVNEFIPRRRYEIRDDHLRLHDIAKIPTCDVIDFDYPYWHTEKDTPDQCSAMSLAKVGWVIQEWLKQAN